MKFYHVIGVKTKSGEFTDDNGNKRAYDNVLLQCIVESTSGRDKKNLLGGVVVEEIKLKNDFNNIVYAGEYAEDVDNFKRLVGCVVELDQDPEGKIDSVDVVSMSGYKLVKQDVE